MSVSGFAIVVGGLVLTERLGRYFHDRMRLSNVDADLSSEPDGMFASRATLKEGRVHLIEGSVDTTFIERTWQPKKAV